MKIVEFVEQGIRRSVFQQTAVVANNLMVLIGVKRLVVPEFVRARGDSGVRAREKSPPKPKICVATILTMIVTVKSTTTAGFVQMVRPNPVIPALPELPGSGSVNPVPRPVKMDNGEPVQEWLFPAVRSATTVSITIAMVRWMKTVKATASCIRHAMAIPIATVVKFVSHFRAKARGSAFRIVRLLREFVPAIRTVATHVQPMPLHHRAKPSRCVPKRSLLEVLVT